MNSITHKSELAKFTNYLNSKKESCLKEGDLMCSDFKSDNLTQEIYNKEDVRLSITTIKI